MTKTALTAEIGDHDGAYPRELLVDIGGVDEPQRARLQRLRIGSRPAGGGYSGGGAWGGRVHRRAPVLANRGCEPRRRRVKGTRAARVESATPFEELVHKLIWNERAVAQCNSICQTRGFRVMESRE